MIKVRLLLGVICMLCVGYAHSQVLRGYIIDAESGESLPNVNVYSSKAGLYSTTNEYGYFSIRLEAACPCEINFSFIGYESLKKSYTVNDLGKFQTIELKQNPSNLNEIVVRSGGKDLHKFPIGLVAMPIGRLKKIPAIFGETDILKALTLTPGVANATEGTAGILVRGGSPDQNLILLDETPVYNVTHLFGFVSVFNPDAIKDVKLYKAGFPARYGGRLSSVIDITSKEGSSKKSNKEFSLGLINSRLLLEGPLNLKSKNQGTYLLAARLTNLSLLLLPTYFNYKFGNGGQFLNYNLYDVNLKWNKAFKDHSQLLLSAYNGNDQWYVKSNYDDVYGKYKINWGNFTGSLRYIKPVGQKIFFKNTLAYSHYGYGLGASMGENKKTEQFVKSKSSLHDFLLKSMLEVYPNTKNEIFIGGELTDHTYKPINLESTYQLRVENNNEKVKAFERAAFAEWKTEISSWFMLQMGTRLAAFSVEDTTYNSFEPRLAMSLYPLKKTALKFGYSKMGQFIHLLNSSSGGLPNDLWIPSSKNLPFERSEQFSVGLSQSFKESWRIDFDIYRKNYSNLVDYKAGQNFLINDEANYNDLLEKDGIGKSYGMEILVDKSEGKFTGWLAYTYAFNFRKFDNINKGAWYAANFDRRHTLNITGAYKLSDRVDLSANWIFQTGTPITVPVATHSQFVTNGNKYLNYIYGDRNNFRTPNYHRLDLNANFSKETRRGNKRVISLGVYNAYNHNNSFFLKTDSQPIFDGARENILGSDIRVTKNNFIPFLPYINYSLIFK